MTDITIPEDTKPSRLQKAPRSENPDDFARAGDRIAAFWRKHKDGSILTEVEPRETVSGDVVYTVRAFVRKDAESATPDTTAHATRSTADPDEITAAFPQETAETAAISRALRNLGILAVPKRPKASS